MNDFLKMNELIEFLKADEKNKIDQFKKQLEQELSNNEPKNDEPKNDEPKNDEPKNESLDTSNNEIISNNDKITKMVKLTSQDSDKIKNINTDTISDKETVLEHYIENNSIETTEKLLNENISIETNEKISEKEIQNNNSKNNININTQTGSIKNINENTNENHYQCNIKKDIGFVLFCFDHRFINNMYELLNRDETVKSFDYFALAGGSLGFLKNDLGCWDKTCIEHIELAHKIHNIKKIIIIDHEDCEMYKDYYNDLKKHPRREKKHHINNLTELMELLEKQFKLTVDAFILNLDGSFIKI